MPGRTGSMAVGLVLAVLALFMAPLSIRELSTAWNREAFVRDELELDAFRESRGNDSSNWLEGHVVSTGERFATDLTDLIGQERLRELMRGGRLKGYREPVWYLPAQGAWAAVDRLVAFRVRSLDDFAYGLPLGLIGFDLAAAATSVLLIRRAVVLPNAAGATA